LPININVYIHTHDTYIHTYIHTCTHTHTHTHKHTHTHTNRSPGTETRAESTYNPQGQPVDRKDRGHTTASQASANPAPKTHPTGVP